jgi:hypothetical protein
MKKENRFFLSCVSGGMEISWLYAWAHFLMISISDRPFPFREAISAFILSSALTRISKGRGWRMVWIIALQVFGFVWIALRMIYTFYSFSNPFFSRAWLAEFFNRPRGPLEWFTLVLLLFFTLLFWVGGVRLARRPMGYATLCTRFDWGLSAFFILYLTQFLVRVKGGIEIEHPLSQFLLFPFFGLSLLAIGLARNQSASPKDFLPGYQGIGVILSFTFTVLLSGAFLVLFFLPFLTLISQVGYSILKTAAKPIGLVFVSILRFLFFRNTGRMDTPPPSKDGNFGNLASPVEGSGWFELLEKVLGWGLGGLVGLAALILSGLAIVYLFRWLFSRTSISRRSQGPWEMFLLWTVRLKHFLLACWSKMVHRGKGYPKASRLYNALLCWGRHSGLSHSLSETPAEYGLRLKHHFPALNREIDRIIEAFHQEVYGERVLSEQQMVATQSAWQRLHSPFHWPSRLKARYFRSLDQNNG